MATKKPVEQENEDKPKLKAWDIYSDDEKEDYRELVTCLTQMRNNLQRPLVEFDDLTFFQQYEENRKADLAYNRPIDETVDFRVTTGLTREKDTTLLSTLTSMNYQPNITAFDKDNSLIAGLGEEMEDLVIKSRELENWDEKRVSIYREFIAQGTVYVEEVYVERAIPKAFETNWMPDMPIAEFKGDEMPIYDVEGKCEAKLHLGKYVMTSSMNEEEVQNNSVVAIYEEIDRAEAKSIYGGWERWKYVPEEVTEVTNPFTDSQQTTRNGSDFSWNTYKVGKGKVGVTKIFKRFCNEYQILLNGVMMLPCDFPLTKISPSGLYPIGKGVNERIPNFAFGKGIPSKTRVDQKLYDTLLRAMVGKAWQSYRPTLGNRSGNVMSRDMIASGQMIHGIKQNDIFPLLPAQLLTLTTGDISMFQMVKEMINDKSVTDSYSAQTQQSNTTATQIINEQKQTMLKLGASIDGIKSLEKRLILLRIYNIIAHWTKANESPLEEEVTQIVDGVTMVVGKKVNPLKTEKKYKKFTQEKSFDDGKSGYKMTQFIGSDAKLPAIREQINMEDKMAEEYGKPVRLSYLNAEWLRNIRVIWDIGVTIQSDQDDQMQLLVFIDNLTRIAQLFGVQAFKQDYVLQRIASKMSEDFDKMFNVQDMAGSLEALKEQLGTQVKNPAQQIANSQRPSPTSVAKVMA